MKETNLDAEYFLNVGFYHSEKKKSNRVVAQKKVAPTPPPIEKEVDKEKKEITEKKSSIALAEIQNEIPLTVDCLTVPSWIHF